MPHRQQPGRSDASAHWNARHGRSAGLCLPFVAKTRQEEDDPIRRGSSATFDWRNFGAVVPTRIGNYERHLRQ
jgi:hypothetical protein